MSQVSGGTLPRGVWVARARSPKWPVCPQKSVSQGFACALRISIRDTLKWGFGQKGGRSGPPVHGTKSLVSAFLEGNKTENKSERIAIRSERMHPESKPSDKNTPEKQQVSLAAPETVGNGPQAFCVSECVSRGPTRFRLHSSSPGAASFYAAHVSRGSQTPGTYRSIVYCVSRYAIFTHSF